MDTRARYLSLASVVLICLLGVAVYSNTLNSSFQFDDTNGLSSITENFGIRDIRNLEAIWNIWPMRFVTFFTFALNYHFGRLNVFGYHLFNLVIHICAALFVQWLVILTFLTPALKEEKAVKYSNLIALFAGLIFVCHPIQTNAVTYVSQRAASMATFFYLASLGLYVKSRLLQQEGKWFVLPYCASLVSAVMAMFTKEMTITLPFMMLVYEISFLKAKRSINWKYIFPFLIILLIIPFTMVFAKAVDFIQIRRVPEPPAGFSPWEYLLTQTRVILTYIRLTLLPLNQNLDYDYRTSKTLFEPSVLLSLGFIIIILAAAMRAFQKYRLISFGVFWFFLTLLPESSVIPIKDVIFEHRLYLPMVGFSIFLVSSIYYLFGDKSIKPVIMILATAVIFYSILAYNRNIIWKDGFTLWNDVVRKSPGKARPYYNRGLAYQTKGELDQAISDYDKAIKIKPDFYEAYNNRGCMYKDKGNLDRAMFDFNKALEIAPKCYDAYNNRGSAYLLKGDLDRAIADFNMALKINPDYYKAYSNRGSAYQLIGEFDQAIADYNKALEIKPDFCEAYNNRGFAYQLKGELGQAISDYNKAIEIKPDYSDAYNNRGGIYQIKGYLDRAISDYDKALKIKPDLYKAYNNRGLAYQSKGELDKAIADYDKALEIKPDFYEAYNNRSGAYKMKSNLGKGS